jgi:hypothetical protein
MTPIDPEEEVSAVKQKLLKMWPELYAPADVAELDSSLTSTSAGITTTSTGITTTLLNAKAGNGGGNSSSTIASPSTSTIPAAVAIRAEVRERLSGHPTRTTTPPPTTTASASSAKNILKWIQKRIPTDPDLLIAYGVVLFVLLLAVCAAYIAY